MVSSNFLRDNRGGWRLERLEDGGTRATYFIDFKLSPLVPRSITNRLIRFQLPAMLREWQIHAEGLYRTRAEAV